MVTPEGASEAGTWPVQIGGAIIALGSLAAMIVNAFRPKREEEVAHRAVKETVTLGDDKLVTDPLASAVGFLRRIAENTDILVKNDNDRKASEELMRARAQGRIDAQQEQINSTLARIEDAEERRRRDRERHGATRN